MNHRPSIAALVAFALASFAQIQPCPEGPDKTELFGLKLKACSEAMAEGKPSKCQLFGKIKVVEHFADVKIQVVEHFPDIKIKLVQHFADSPGEWTMVEHFPDYKIQFVSHFPDYKIKYVEHFPGCD